MTGAFYVIRGKESLQAQSYERKENHGRKAEGQIQGDLDIELVAPNTRKKYPKRLRMVVFYDEKEDLYMELLTNNFTWTASTIAELYKRRWSIEAFFKDIKTHLKIKTFVGTSLNAVMIQIWTALICILLLKTLQKSAAYAWRLSNLVAFIRLNLFVKIELKKWLDQPFIPEENTPLSSTQLQFF